MKRIVRDEVIFSDMVAISDDKGNKITYKELTQKAEKLSEYIEERSVIFFLCDHQMETVETLYQILYLNRVPLLLSSDIDKDLLDGLIAVYQPQYIYCTKSHKIADLYSLELELENHVLLNTGKSKYAIHDDVALLLSTSGTTGSTKLVKLSYENLYDNAEYISLRAGIQSGQKGICPLPIHYTFGFSACLWHWHRGGTLLITEEFVISSKFREFYEREKINNFAATPYIYRMLQKVQFWDQEKVSYLNYAVSGGERMPEKEQMELVSVMKGKLWCGYGQTECTCGITLINLKNSDKNRNSVGKALDNTEIIIDDETNELIVKSKSVCMGYANNIEQLAEGDVNHGILHTGDMADIDHNGYVYLKGRLTRYVKILGKRVSLDDIEKYLEGLFSEVEFACTGTDNHILVFYSDQKNGLDEKVPVLLDRNMKIPQKFVSCIYLEKIPRNDRGKIIYTDLRE